RPRRLLSGTRSQKEAAERRWSEQQAAEAARDDKSSSDLFHCLGTGKTHSGLGARPSRSPAISWGDWPSWQTRRTASVIGISTPQRAASSWIDEQDLTPSATWPWVACWACSTVSPSPSR